MSLMVNHKPRRNPKTRHYAKRVQNHYRAKVIVGLYKTGSRIESTPHDPELTRYAMHLVNKAFKDI